MDNRRIKPTPANRQLELFPRTGSPREPRAKLDAEQLARDLAHAARLCEQEDRQRQR